MANRLKEIRETTSDAVSIIRELGAPGVHESLGTILETTKTIKEIVDGLKTPEFVKNIENIRFTTQAMQDASTKLENTIREIKEAGVLDEARDAIKSTNDLLSSVSGSNEFADVARNMNATFSAMKDLVDEIKLTLVLSKRKGMLNNAATVVKESSELYHNITDSK